MLMKIILHILAPLLWENVIVVSLIFVTQIFDYSNFQAKYKIVIQESSLFLYLQHIVQSYRSNLESISETNLLSR